MCMSLFDDRHNIENGHKRSLAAVTASNEKYSLGLFIIFYLGLQVYGNVNQNLVIHVTSTTLHWYDSTQCLSIYFLGDGRSHAIEIWWVQWNGYILSVRNVSSPKMKYTISVRNVVRQKMKNGLCFGLTTSDVGRTDGMFLKFELKGPVTRVPHRPTHKKRMRFNAWKANDVDKGEK